jgi:hypothetical protein
MELKFLLPTLAKSWASSAHAILKIGHAGVDQAPAPAIAAFPLSETVPLLVHTPEIATPDLLLSLLRERLKEHGARGIFELQRKFFDYNNSATADLADFTQMIVEYSFDWTPKQIQLLFDSFDTDRSGSILYDEFLERLKGMLNERRVLLVLIAFQVTDNK